MNLGTAIVVIATVFSIGVAGLGMSLANIGIENVRKLANIHRTLIDEPLLDVKTGDHVQ